MKDGDKLVTQDNLMNLEKLALVREQKAKELRLQIWLAVNKGVRI